MYVDELFSFVKIAEQIPVNEKTLRKWAKEFGWFQLRKESLQAQTTSVEQAEKIAKKLGDKLDEILNAGKLPEASLVQAYRGLLRDLKPIKTYDTEKKKEVEQSEQKPELKDITIAAINNIFK